MKHASHAIVDIHLQRPPALAGSAVAGAASRAVYDDIVQLAISICDAPAAAIYLCENGRQVCAAQVGPDYPSSPRTQAICDAAVSDALPLWVIEDVAHDARFAATAVRIGQPALRFYAGALLRNAQGRVLGIVCVMDSKPRQLSVLQHEGLTALGRQAQLFLDLRRDASRQQQLLSQYQALSAQQEDARLALEQRNQILQRTANHDELTGLLNRSALTQLRDNPRAMQKLQSAPYSLALLDVDNFKQVNDRHGHLIGDRALRVVADAVKASVRDGDVAVRIGGEEFLLVLPGTGLPIAFEVAHRIRERVSASLSLPFALTVSIGLASADPSRDQPEQVFERADQALYQAKAAGRDRVVADDTPR